MGSTELVLLLKFGVPLAVKLLKSGKTEPETVEVVTTAITNLEAGEFASDVETALLGADEQQTKNIIDGLFGVITGAANAVGGLLQAICGLFGVGGG